jgi:hypothetical protein
MQQLLKARAFENMEFLWVPWLNTPVFSHIHDYVTPLSIEQFKSTLVADDTSIIMYQPPKNGLKQTFIKF